MTSDSLVDSSRFADPRPAWGLPMRMRDESLPRRLLGLALAAAVAVGFFAFVISYWHPAHFGVDQNGYLYGGRRLAESGSTGFRPTVIQPYSDEDLNDIDPAGFVGRMMVGIDVGGENETYHPKYPVGLPLLIAICWWGGHLLGNGNADAVYAAHLISPVCMSLATFGTFLLGRRLAGSFYGLLAQILLASSPLITQLAINPNSHAADTFFVVWGMVFLLGWLDRGGPWRGFIAGFLLSYATTIRYTDALLVMPFLFAALLRWRAAGWNLRHSWQELLIAGIGYAIPTGALLAYNYHFFGTATGYDPTRESGGFRWEYLADNWDVLLRRMDDTALPLVFPLAIAGMLWMVWRYRAAGILWWLWVAPCLLIYGFYYWAPDGDGLGYLRFFTVVVPALTVAAMWLVADIDAALRHHPGPAVVPVGGQNGNGSQGHRLPHLLWWKWLAAGVVVILAIAAFLTLPRLDREAGELIPWSDYLEGSKTLAWVYALQTTAAVALTATIALAAVSGRRLVPVAAAGLVLAGGIGVNGRDSISGLERELFSRGRDMAYTDEVLLRVPPGGVVFLNREHLGHHLQFAGDYELYDADYFTSGGVRRHRPPDTSRTGEEHWFEDAEPLDPSHRLRIWGRLGKLSDSELAERQKKLAKAALQQGRRVFWVYPLSRRQWDEWRQKLTWMREDEERKVELALGIDVPIERERERRFRDRPAELEMPGETRRLRGDGLRVEHVITWGVPDVRDVEDEAYVPRGRRGEFIRREREQDQHPFQIIEIKLDPPAEKA